jgi:pentatricopeptide repeat protein
MLKSNKVPTADANTACKLECGCNIDHRLLLTRGCMSGCFSLVPVQVFEQLLRRRVSFNSYTYHCLLQLCGSAGSIDDALAVYNLQVGY